MRHWHATHTRTTAAHDRNVQPQHATRTHSCNHAHACTQPHTHIHAQTRTPDCNARRRTAPHCIALHCIVLHACTFKRGCASFKTRTHTGAQAHKCAGAALEQDSGVAALVGANRTRSLARTLTHMSTRIRSGARVDRRHAQTCVQVLTCADGSQFAVLSLSSLGFMHSHLHACR